MDLDYRSAPTTPVATIVVSNPAVTGATTIDRTFTANGILRAIKLGAIDLTTDTTYSVTIKDPDGIVIYTNATAADNGFLFVLRTADTRDVMASNAYTVTWTWSTSQDLVEGNLQVVLFLTNI